MAIQVFHINFIKYCTSHRLTFYAQFSCQITSPSNIEYVEKVGDNDVLSVSKLNYVFNILLFG